MDGDAVGQGSVEPGHHFFLVFNGRFPAGERITAMAVDDTPAGNHEGLTRQNTLDPVEDGVGPGRELQLEQLIPYPHIDAGFHETGGDHCLRLGREGEALAPLDVIQGFDPERVARQHQPVRGGVVKCDGVHAAQLGVERRAIATVQMKRRLAVGRGGE